MEQTVPAVSGSGSMATPFIPQSILSEPLDGPMLTEGAQRERYVLFDSIFDM